VGPQRRQDNGPNLIGMYALTSEKLRSKDGRSLACGAIITQAGIGRSLQEDRDLRRKVLWL
jgi:hypothetical protein